MNTAVLDINNLPDIQIGYIDTIHKNYCSNSNCIEGRIFNPYTHIWKDCPTCLAINQHNLNIKMAKYKEVMGDDITLGSTSKDFNTILKHMNDFEFPAYSFILDAKSLRLDLLSLYIEYINTVKAPEVGSDFRLNVEIMNKGYNKDIRDIDHLILIAMKDIEWEEIRYLSSMLLFRSFEMKPTLIISYHAINKFYEDILTDEYRFDRVKVLK